MKDQDKIKNRVIQSAEAALRDQFYVNLPEVLMRMGLLYPGHVQDWKKGKIPLQLEVLDRATFETIQRLCKAGVLFFNQDHTKLLPSQTPVVHKHDEQPRRLKANLKLTPMRLRGDTDV